MKEIQESIHLAVFDHIRWSYALLSDERRSHARTSTGIRYISFSKLLDPARRCLSGVDCGFPKQLPSFKRIPPITAFMAQLRRNVHPVLKM
jgi:hypothetical protein